MVKLSVVIPCYNKADYLIEMVSSIIRQTFKEWELILVDDGSAEESFNKIHDFVSTDNRILHIRRHRLPKNGDTCRNIGIEMAKGEYIIIFDADDLISETCFENRVKFMDEHPTCDYASFPSASFNDGSSVNKKRPFNESNNDLLESILSANYPFTVWGNIYRISSIRNIRWDENLYIYQDFDFMVQCVLANLKHAWAIGYDVDYYYRLFSNGNSVCSKVITKQKIQSTNYLFKKTLESIGKRIDSDKLEKCFFHFILLFFEQLMLYAKSEDIMDTIKILEAFYPVETPKMYKIMEKRRNIPCTHWQLFVVYFHLYSEFKEKVHRAFMTHEFIKAVLFVK